MKAWARPSDHGREDGSEVVVVEPDMDVGAYVVYLTAQGSDKNHYYLNLVQQRHGSSWSNNKHHVRRIGTPLVAAAEVTTS